MPGFTRALALAAASIPAAAAAAQEPSRPSAEASDIVVTGQDVEAQIRDFVGALTIAPPRGQLARFERKVCPAAIGLRPGQKQAVVDRLRRVAGAAGLELGGPRCTPNVLLIVTADKRAFLEALERKHDYYFGAMTPTQVRRLVRQPGPATAWQIEGPPLDSDGVETAQGGEAMLPGAEYPVNRTTKPLSRIAAAGRPQFQAAALVVEAGALDGLTTLQLADYAAMRLFARTDPDRLPDPAPATILRILDAPMGSEVPLTLTTWDFAFLKSFYAGADNLYAASERSEIRRRMAKELAGEQRGH